DGFAGLGGHDSVLLVGRRRGGDVDGVHLGVGDQLAPVGVPPGHAVAGGVVSGLGSVAAHDGDKGGVGSFLERGTAFDLGDVAAADDAPADGGHGREHEGSGGGNQSA